MPSDRPGDELRLLERDACERLADAVREVVVRRRVAIR
jgi:hypothetical protein